MGRSAKIWGIGFLLIFAAILIPIGINLFNGSDTIDHAESFTAVEDSSTAEIVDLTFKPVQAASDVVKVNGATVTRDSDYTINNTTAVITFATATSDVGDTIAVTYTEAVDYGGVSPLWFILPTIALLMFLYNLYKSSGGTASSGSRRMRSRRRRG